MVGDRAGRVICNRHEHEYQGTNRGDTIFILSTTFMCGGYELPGAAGGAEEGGGGGGGGAEAVVDELTPAALMESNVTSLKAGMSSGLQAQTYKQIFKKKG